MFQYPHLGRLAQNATVVQDVEVTIEFQYPHLGRLAQNRNRFCDEIGPK